MGFKTKIQLIQRAKSEQWYINFPSALAQTMELDKAEIVEWVVQDKHCLILKRIEAISKVPKKTDQNSLIDCCDLLLVSCPKIGFQLNP